MHEVDTIEARLDNVELMNEVMRAAWRDVCIRHKSAGVPIVVVQDGAVVRIPPGEIVIPHEADEAGDRAQKS